MRLETWQLDAERPRGEPIHRIRAWNADDVDVDKLADQESWDYERYGATCTYIVIGAGFVPLALEPAP